jgi:hypothetical protein
MAIAHAAIKIRLRGQRYRFYTRVCANIGVYTKGNEARMGKGKGSFDYWAARVPVSRIIFELKGDLHEQIVRDAFRLAGNKLPGEQSIRKCEVLRIDIGIGLYEFVKKGDPPVMGITKMEAGVTLEDMKRPRLNPPPKLPLNVTAGRLPASTPP